MESSSDKAEESDKTISKQEDNSEQKHDIDKILAKRTNKFLSFIKNKNNIWIILILALALVIRFYYFILTKDQTLWFDELAYGGIAKTNFFTGGWSGYPTGVLLETAIRPPLLSAFWMILINLNFPELASKFILEFVPSVLSVLLIYMIGKQIYNKKTAIIASIIIAVSWIHIFYSLRFLTHIPAMFFSLVSIYFFFKSIDSEKIRQKHLALSILFLSLAILMRFSFGLVGLSYLIFLIIIRPRIFRQKKFWLGGIIGILPLIAFFIINLSLFGHFFPATDIYSTTQQEQTQNAYYTFSFFSHMLKGPFFYLFLLGIILAIAQLIIGYDLIKKTRKIQFSLFLLILLALNLIFLIFWLRVAEDRYLFESFISVIFFISLGIIYISDFVKKHNKIASVSLILLLIAWGMYAQFSYGDAIIKDKAKSFSQMKEAFLWLNENAPEGSKIMGRAAEYYTIYYAGNLLPLTLPKEEPSSIDLWAESLGILPDNWPNQGFDNYELEVDYIIISAYHPTQDYFQEYLSTIQDRLSPEHALFINPEQPSVIIYKVNKN